ncbi:MAG: PQQ-dependent sugar dehydrogenase [Planctomycetota bacterium]
MKPKDSSPYQINRAPQVRQTPKPRTAWCRLVSCVVAQSMVLVVAVTAIAESPSDASIERLQQYALTQPGDATNGKTLFRDTERTKCLTCHVVGKEGGKVGPDLSRIGGKFDRPHLIESLLEPSRQIVEGYRSSIVLTEEGQTRTGIIQSESEATFELRDADGKVTRYRRDEIETIRTSGVSLMPDRLANDLTAQEFVDLIAYLETLRSGVATKFGAGVSGPIQVEGAFQVQTVVTSLDGATALQILPDGRILLCEQTGALRVFKDGQLNVEPMLTVTVDSTWERGLIGVTVDPNFENEPYVYVCYVAPDPYPHHRISRFRVEGDIAIAASEKILLEGDDQNTLGGNVPAGHQGGALHFGNDGKLYVGLGEQTAGLPAQRLNTLQGKILRINRDGSIPVDNPLVEDTTGKYQSIWAYGCRNPFTLAFQRSTGRLYINDVGGRYEEINAGVAGANYGWPMIEHGPTRRKGFVGPDHIYPQASISGGDFLSTNVSADSSWPSEFREKYFFADFVHGWIKWIDPENPKDAQTFASGLRRPVDIRFSPDGSLYVLLRNAWVIDGKFEGGTGSLMRISPKSSS